MVINIGALKSGERDLVESEIRALGGLARRSRALLKVILETALLSTEEKILACQLCLRAKADFVKTSTGFSSAGATAADVALMRGVVGHEMGVKAAGGIRSAADLRPWLRPEPTAWAPAPVSPSCNRWVHRSDKQMHENEARHVLLGLAWRHAPGTIRISPAILLICFPSPRAVIYNVSRGGSPQENEWDDLRV